MYRDVQFIMYLYFKISFLETKLCKGKGEGKRKGKALSILKKMSNTLILNEENIPFLVKEI